MDNCTFLVSQPEIGQINGVLNNFLPTFPRRINWQGPNNFLVTYSIPTRLTLNTLLYFPNIVTQNDLVIIFYALDLQSRLWRIIPPHFLLDASLWAQIIVQTQVVWFPSMPEAGVEVQYLFQEMNRLVRLIIYPPIP